MLGVYVVRQACTACIMFVGISSLREYSENNENYIEIPLIFDPVIREDLNTDFTCVVRNTLGIQMLHTTVKEGMYFRDIKRENMLTILWKLDRTTSSLDDYLVSPLCFLLVEH